MLKWLKSLNNVCAVILFLFNCGNSLTMSHAYSLPPLKKTSDYLRLKRRADERRRRPRLKRAKHYDDLKKYFAKEILLYKRRNYERTRNKCQKKEDFCIFFQ